MRKLSTLFLIVISFVMSGCAVSARSGIMDSDVDQLKIRQIQTRYYDINDEEKAMRAVIATLQDFGFIIDKASFALGSISATKLSGYQLKMTVIVTARGETQMMIRANAQYNITPIVDPTPYQQFFEALSKSLFLEAQLVE